MLREADKADTWECAKCQGRQNRVCFHPTWGRSHAVAKSPNLPPLNCGRQDHQKILDHVRGIGGYESESDLECFMRYNICPVAFITPDCHFALELYGVVGGMNGLRTSGILDQPAALVTAFSAIEHEVNRLNMNELKAPK